MRYHYCYLPAGNFAVVDADLFYVIYEFAPHLALDSFPTRRSSDLGIRRVLVDEQAVHIEFCESASEHPSHVMPFPVVVRKRADRNSTHMNSSHRTKDYADPCVELYTELPRIAAPLDSTVIGRRIRR